MYGYRSCNREVLNSLFRTKGLSHLVAAHLSSMTPLIPSCEVCWGVQSPKKPFSPQPPSLARCNTNTCHQIRRCLLSLAVSPSLPACPCRVFSTQLQKALPREGAVIPQGGGSGAEGPWGLLLLVENFDQCYCN